MIRVACLGSSSTAGRGQAFDWIGELQQRPQNRELRMLNFGRGGDLAFNALDRVREVVACCPQLVVVWIGANDVLAEVFPNVRRFFRIAKRLSREPSLPWFRDNLRSLARRLKIESPAVALCSLAPIGEDVASSETTQRTLNQRIAEYSATIRAIAREEGADYIPVYETLNAQMATAPGKVFGPFRFSAFYRDAFRAVVQRKSADEIARINGWRFHTDGVHLNRRGGMLVSELVQRFIDERKPVRSSPGAK